MTNEQSSATVVEDMTDLDPGEKPVEASGGPGESSVANETELEESPEVNMPFGSDLSINQKVRTVMRAELGDDVFNTLSGEDLGMLFMGVHNYHAEWMPPQGEEGYDLDAYRERLKLAKKYTDALMEDIDKQGMRKRWSSLSKQSRSGIIDSLMRGLAHTGPVQRPS